jgi:hypothetical protein
LDDRSNSEKIVQDVIERLKQEQTLCEYLDSNRLLRDLYHYIRAWAIVRGLFGSWDLTAHDILRLYHDTDEDPDNASNHGDQSFPALILCFFEDNPYRSAVPRGKYDGVWNLSAPSDSDDNLEGSEQDTEDGLEMPRGCPRFRPYKLFRKVEAQPLHKRLAFSHYIRVKVLPMSPSKMKIAACISVVERRLQKLKERK